MWKEKDVKYLSCLAIYQEIVLEQDELKAHAWQLIIIYKKRI